MRAKAPRPRWVTWSLAAGLLATAVILALFVTRGEHRERPPDLPAAAPTPPAEPPDRVVVPGGRDVGDCTPAAPCGSLTYADTVAAPGDVVEIRSGRYPAQELATVHGEARAKPVVFRPETGGRVRLEYVTVEGAGIELRGAVTQGWTVAPGAHDITLRDVEARGAVFVTSAKRVRVLGGSVGPGDSKDSQIKAADTEGAPVPTDILIDGVDFHDWTREEDPAAHVECLQVGGARRLVIRNSTFRNCATQGLFIRSWGGTARVEAVTIEHNTFGATVEGYYALRVAGMDGMRYRGIAVRDNRSEQSLLVDQDAAREVSFEGNIAPRAPYTCYADQEFSENLWNGAQCGPTDRDTAAGQD